MPFAEPVSYCKAHVCVTCTQSGSLSAKDATLSGYAFSCDGLVIVAGTVLYRPSTYTCQGHSYVSITMLFNCPKKRNLVEKRLLRWDIGDKPSLDARSETRFSDAG